MTAANYPLFVETFATPDMQVAIGRMCLGETTKDWPSIALGYGQKVHILCGNSEGRYDAINEEPTVKFGTALDYVMNSNPQGLLPSATVSQFQYWGPTHSLHVLWSDSPHEIVRFAPPVVPDSNEGVPVADLKGRTSARAFYLHQNKTEYDPQWTQIVVLVDASGSTDVSFAR